MLIVCFGILWCIGYISAIYSNDDYLYTNIQVTLLSSYVCLFVCLFLYVPLENMKTSPLPMIWSLVGTIRLWKERKLYHLPSIVVCVFVCCYTFRSRISHSHVDFTPCWWFKIVSASLALKEGGSFLEPHLMWQGTSVNAISSEGPLHFGRLLRQARGTENLYSPRCTGNTPIDNIIWQMKTVINKPFANIFIIDLLKYYMLKTVKYHFQCLYLTI